MLDITSLIKSAILSKDKVALNAYKNLKAEEQKFLTAKNAPKELTSEAQLSIFSKYAKNLEDAIKQFSDANRDDLVSEYTSELEVVKKLLPAPVSESQICSELCKWYFTYLEKHESENPVVGLDSPAIPKKEMGNVIKYLKSKFPTADGKIISNIVKEYLV